MTSPCLMWNLYDLEMESGKRSGNGLEFSLEFSMRTLFERTDFVLFGLVNFRSVLSGNKNKSNGRKL